MLGAAWDGSGTGFSVFSTAGAYGGAVELCLLDEDGGERRVAMEEDQEHWSAYVPGAGPGQRYGFRASGPWEPGRGLRFDARTLLADPYGHAFEEVAPRRLQTLVADHAFDWGGDAPPRTPWADTVLYETHVKGITATHPDVPLELRGTYLGVASPPVVEHLTGLGVTAVELLPVHQFISEQRLLDMGLVNYWGYMTVGFLAPHAAYRSAPEPAAQVAEFKSMVKELHAAGLEVILDVVYNHTGEGPPDAPAISFRGLANEAYYRLDPRDPSRYIDTTGTTNTLNVDRRNVLRLIMDSLRHWVLEYHVDGFRFDLATTLARDTGSFDRLAAFFDLVYQDPIVNRVKLIAEPWDVAFPDGYQVGRFPLGWSEWNDRYRNAARDFWSRRGRVGELANRLSGSSDLYGLDRRGPDTSINFVTAHDGKTLADLVTYERKHNEANGEGNRDGTDDDRAENHGVEGPTSDPVIVAVRARQRRNMLATLLVSQGVAMVLGGDEIGRTQRGNNNAYCQDNDLSWYDWTPSEDAERFTAFTARVIDLQRRHPVLRRRVFLDGRVPEAGGLPDVSWFDGQGEPMSDALWNDPANHSLAFLLAGDRAGAPDDDLLVVVHAGLDATRFRVPGRPGARYLLELDTATDDGAPAPHGPLEPGSVLEVAPRTVLVAAAPLA